MRKVLPSAALATALIACSVPEREVVATRDQFGDAWPLAVSSALVECDEGGDVAILKVGTQRYALSPQARSAGYAAPDSEVAQADTEPLRALCDPEVAAR